MSNIVLLGLLTRSVAMSYGMAMRVLGWGGTRAAKAEDRLRKSGRIAYGKHGRAVVVNSDASGKEL
ncbi:hypothetical protein [Bartonella apis]|uniref:hypothetical protein n=1 Tax=Bartonella apis TaxID=1686310 RepID=UPI002431D04E|nr:hypothetical protein [Bartonella apis]